MNDKEMGEIGIAGTHGPNDNGYLNLIIRRAAKELVSASSLWSEGHYPHSNARVMPENHHIALALKHLAEMDKETAEYANVKHAPKLFEPYVPSVANQTRWDRPELMDKPGEPVLPNLAPNMVMKEGSSIPINENDYLPEDKVWRS